MDARVLEGGDGNRGTSEVHLVACQKACAGEEKAEFHGVAG